MNDHQMFCEPDLADGDRGTITCNFYKILRVVHKSLCYNEIVHITKVFSLLGDGGISFMDRKRMAALWSVLLLIFMQTVCVSADASVVDPEDSYISLGADLTEAEKSIVLGIFGLEEADLGAYRLTSVTNQEEHQYLDDHLDRGIIGDRALSSVMVTSREEGYGIHVTTQNISYCTIGMYQNALSTAGVRDVDIVVAGPFSISGTAALIGAIKSYEGLTGETIDSGQIDAANRELAVASRLGQVLDDPARAEQLISMVKNEVITNDHTQGEVSAIIDQTASEMQVDLTQEDKQKILDLMDEVQDLDLDIDDLKQQVTAVYSRLQDVGLSVEKEQAKGFLDRLWEKFENFIVALF